MKRHLVWFPFDVENSTSRDEAIWRRIQMLPILYPDDESNCFGVKNVVLLIVAE